MERLELAQTIEALRAELAQAVEEGSEAPFHFPVDGVQLEFHVAVKKNADAKAGVKFYVIEVGGSGGYSREEIQTVTLSLGAPVDARGDPVKVYRGSANEP